MGRTALMTTQKLPSPLIGYRTSRVKYRFESFSHIQTVYDNKRRAGSPSNPSHPDATQFGTASLPSDRLCVLVCLYLFCVTHRDSQIYRPETLK